MFNTAQQVGGALGLAVLSTLAANTTVGALQELGRRPTPADTASALVDGFHVAFFAAGVLVLIGAVVLAAVLRPSDVANVNPEEMPVPA